MTVLAVVSGRSLNIVHSEKADVKDFKQAEALVVGDAAYQTSAGKAGKADANVAGKEQFRGLVMRNTGGFVSLLKQGYVAGYDLSGVAYDAPIFLSDTAGKLDTAAGTLEVRVGRVVALADKNLTKVLYIEADWLRTWVAPEE